MARKRGQPKPPDRKRLRARFRQHFHAVKARVTALSLRTPAEAASVTALCAIVGACPDAGVLSTIGLGTIGSLWANYLSKSGHSGAPTEVPPELIQQFLAHDQAQRELTQFLKEYDLNSVVIEEFGPEALGQLTKVVGEALDEHGVATREDVESLRDTVIERVTPPAPTTPTFPIFSVPHPRNPNFTGRSHLLSSLRDSLTAGGPTALTQAVHGLGGVGKTQLALEYAYLHAAHYTVIYWVRSEEPAQLASDYAALADPLNLPEKDAPDQTAIIAAVRQWLEHSDGWLLVFDNAQHPDAVRDYLPHTADVAAEREPVGATFLSRPSRHIIITSRDPNWGGLAAPLEVPTWPRDESIAFLEKRTGHGGGDADALAHELGDLPLALEQAAAYIEAAGITLSEYLDLFRTHREELWKDEKPPLDYGKTVAATLTIAMERVDEDSPAAADLLALCAFLAPDDIPLSLFRDHAARLPEPLTSTVTDPLALNKAVASLRRYSLLQKDEDALSLHRLVQAVARDRLPEEGRKEWAAVAAAIVNAAFPGESDDVRFWPRCSVLLAHAVAVTSYEPGCPSAAPHAARLLNHVGLYLRARGELVSAKRVLEQSLVLTQRVYGHAHLNTAACLGNLADVLREMGRTEKALQLANTSLDMVVALRGTSHPDVAIRLDKLAAALQAHRELLPAAKCAVKAWAMLSSHLGRDDPQTQRVSHNLALIYQELGYPGMALLRYADALRGAQEEYGKDHPVVAACLSNIGHCFQALKSLADAKHCQTQALQMAENAYGRDHPEVARILNNLGGVLQALNDVPGARRSYERALHIVEQTYGDDHPNTETVRRNLESLDT